MGSTRSSEDSSELVFLLVENYNIDRSFWSSDRKVIFEDNISTSPDFYLYLASMQAVFFFLGSQVELRRWPVLRATEDRMRESFSLHAAF